MRLSYHRLDRSPVRNALTLMTSHDPILGTHEARALLHKHAAFHDVVSVALTECGFFVAAMQTLQRQLAAIQ